MNQKARNFLLSLARQTLVDYFKTGEKLKIDEKLLPSKELAREAATFVTLTEKGDLRGCVGNLVAKKKMYEDVINNALLAGFGDPRFSPLAQEEIKKVKIEISVLSEPKPFTCHSKNELLEEIIPGEHGIIIQKDLCQATFLPQVWADLPQKVQFLESLSQKAGLEKDSWQEKGTELFYYTVEKFSE